MGWPFSCLIGRGRVAYLRG